MIIQTSRCDFLIEETADKPGDVFIYSDGLEETQRYFGSSEVEFVERGDWRYRVKICKQDFANALILMVKEINYRDFIHSRVQQV